MNRLLILLFCLVLILPVWRTLAQSDDAQPAGADAAILYMAYEGTAEGLVLIVWPGGYRVVEIGRDFFGSDSSGRYQREQMIASDDGRWLAISVRDTVEDAILWVPIIALDGGSGSTLFPLPITRAVKLGSFSPDGRYLALAVVGQESPDAALVGGVMVFDLTSSSEFDAPATWWLPLEPRDGQVMWAEIGAWTAQGVHVLPTCYACDERSAGEYLLWEPFTDSLTSRTGVYFRPDVTVLAATGEALWLDDDPDFPRSPGVTAPNVIRYLPTVTPDSAGMTTLYADPRGIAWAQWVLDGQAVLAQPAEVYDAWVLIYRDGRVVAFPHALGIRFVVGSTEGWLAETGNADGYTDILAFRPDGSTTTPVSASGGAIVIRPPHLGMRLPDPPPPFVPAVP